MLDKIRSWIKLTSASGISSARAIKIVNELGEPRLWIDDKDSPLAEFTFVSAEMLQSLTTMDDPPNWQETARLIQQYDLRFVTFFDAEYPEILKLIPDPPVWLFYQGELRQSDYIKSLAVVGTRKPSSYAKVQCHKIVSELVQQQMVIVSGLAYGIDALAHRTALSQGGRTIAVMGTGVEQIYPPEHRQLAEEIRQNGALISEYLPGSKACVWNFPNRNRIISGLSQGTWVVEGGLKSGSLITAKYAQKQKRPVFALPADISRDTSAGSNQLIKEGAFPVLQSRDIMDVLGISGSDISDSGDALQKLNELERKVYQILVNQPEDVQFDKLLVLSKLKVGELSTIILSLELKGFAAKSPGNRLHPIR
ncbi:MAG: DNA-processing protein DprA [Candidatus Cloacimonetes bacterium]|nr:DNA-processing protein DprA [Candidatus Cloacimonadota bacterium]